MNFLTHVLISGTLYRKLSKKMALDRKAFRYGNIKPDLSPQCLRNPHLLENYLFLVQSDAHRLRCQNRSSEGYSVRAYSEDLGVICHYICDFFCYVHQDRVIYHKLLRHFLYELRLHLAFCGLLARNQLGPVKSTGAESRSIAAMVLELRKKYRAKKNTPRRDLDFAILASLRACEMIDQRIGVSSETAEAANS
jgi:hypothetical protein